MGEAAAGAPCVAQLAQHVVAVVLVSKAKGASAACALARADSAHDFARCFCRLPHPFAAAKGGEEYLSAMIGMRHSGEVLWRTRT